MTILNLFWSTRLRVNWITWFQSTWRKIF